MRKIFILNFVAATLFADIPFVQAEIALELGGYYRGYAVWVDQDSTSGANDAELRRDAEVYILGEKELDNGTIVGYRSEHKLTSVAGSTLNEVALYAQGGWGRTVFGLEDGAAYSLQAVIPSADSNIDGVRAQINGVANFGPLTYAASVIPSRVERLTYYTPKLNGFQAGVSYAPRQALARTAALDPDNEDIFEHIHETAANWVGTWQGLDVTVSAGYVGADNKDPAQKDLAEIKSGINIAHAPYAIGFAWQRSNNALSGASDTDFYAAGISYDVQPWHFGLSYLAKEEERAGIENADRVTIGAGYLIGPGISFRAALAAGEDQSVGDNGFTQVTLGTDIQF